jgi:hypothetical protein
MKIVPIGKKCTKCGVFREYSDYPKHHKTKDGRRKVCKYCSKRSGPPVTSNKTAMFRTPTPKSPTSHLAEAARHHPPLVVDEKDMTPFDIACLNILKLEAGDDLNAVAELVKLRMEELEVQSKIFKLTTQKHGSS